MGVIDGPFIGTEALQSGLVGQRALRRRHQTIYRNVYLANDQLLTPTSRAVAAWLWSDRQATVAGLSAAALHGSRWIDAKHPAEYDGEQHRTDPVQRAYDIDRHARLAARGWVVIRVSAEILRYRPHVIVERTCAALYAAGAEWPVIARYLLKNVA